jgi:hypothetical protein
VKELPLRKSLNKLMEVVTGLPNRVTSFTDFHTKDTKGETVWFSQKRLLTREKLLHRKNLGFIMV